MWAQECLSRRESELTDSSKKESLTEASKEILNALDLPAVATSEREKGVLSRLRYKAIRNAIGMEIQMQKRMEALEYIMEAYPSSYTLKEIKDQLEYVMLKNDKEIRELIMVK